MTVDPQRHVVAAVATGATELRTREDVSDDADSDVARTEVARSMRVDVAELREAARTPQFAVYTATRDRGRLLGRLARPLTPVRVVDREGVVRFGSPHAHVRTTTVDQARADLGRALEESTSYGDSGVRVPAIHLLVGARLANLAGVTSGEQILALADTELSGRPDDEPAVLVVEVRT